jgi:hypothetical protein
MFLIQIFLKISTLRIIYFVSYALCEEYIAVGAFLLIVSRPVEELECELTSDG